MTGNLDSTHREDVKGLLSKFNKAGTTILMVTHSPAYVKYGNRIVHLFDWRIVTENMKSKFYV